MAKKFLGKLAPSSSRPHRAVPTGPTSWIVSFLAPVALALVIMYLLFMGQNNTGVTVPSSAINTTQAQLVAVGPVRTLGEAAATNVTVDPCVEATKNLSPVFPLIPAALKEGGACPSPKWNIAVAKFFAGKALIFLNWLAGALAIIFTVWAGVLYISGFANEANVKTARTFLISTYVGLTIVILARLILYGSIMSLTGSYDDPQNVAPPGSTGFIKST